MISSGKGIVTPRWVNHYPFNFLIYFCLLNQYVTTLLFVTGEIEAVSCPCEICPCYCPCTDRRASQFAIVGHADFISVQSYKSDGITGIGFQLFSGASKAARDRDLQLSVYRPFSAEDASRLLQALVREASVNGMVATLYNEMDCFGSTSTTLVCRASRLQAVPKECSSRQGGGAPGVQRMSLRGKALIVNQLLFSKVLYYCLAHPPNDHTIQLIQRIGSNFVWKQKGLISHTVHGWISRDMSFMSWLHGGLGLHNIQWRLWSMYAKQVISVYMEVNTHPGCLLAKESLSAIYTHANGTSWHLDAGVLGCTLISYKGLPWYWSRLWLGYHKLKPGRLVFPTTREEVARQILYFNDLIVDNARKPLGTLHGHNPYAGFLCASPPVLRVLDLYAWQGDRYRLRAYTEVNAWVQNMPSLHAWNTLIQAIPATWHALMMAPRKALQPGDWISFYPDGITSTCKGLVRGVLPPAGIQVQVADTLPGHNGCLNQLATLCVCLPAHQCHRIRMVPWLVSRSCMFQPDPTTPAEAITWLHVGNTRLDTLPLDPLEFGWTLTKGMSRISKCLYEYTAEWGYDILLHENHKLHPGRPRWGFQWPGYSWIKLITVAVDHPLVDRRATDIQHLLLHRAIGVNATLSSRFHHDATCLCTFPSETIEHRFLYCQVSGVWQWLFNVWSAWTALGTTFHTNAIRALYHIRYGGDPRGGAIQQSTSLGMAPN
eukprot:jgi/Mesvir1/17977/Mv09327-RA.1